MKEVEDGGFQVAAARLTGSRVSWRVVADDVASHGIADQPARLRVLVRHVAQAALGPTEELLRYRLPADKTPPSVSSRHACDVKGHTVTVVQGGPVAAFGSTAYASDPVACQNT